MRDWEKHWANRLSREMPFAGQESAWRALRYRLEAADTRRRLRYWQVATASLVVLLIAAGGASYRLHRQNRHLSTQLAEITARWRESTALPVLPPADVAETPLAPSSKTPQRQRAKSILEPTEEGAYSNRAASEGTSVPESNHKAAEERPSDGVRSLAALPIFPLDIKPIQMKAPTLSWLAGAPRRRDSRLWLGLQGTAAWSVPRPGLSVMQGAGVSAEYRFLGQWWLTGAVDWLSYDVHHSDYLPAAFYREKPPQAFKVVIGKPPVPHPLHDVVGNQRLRYISAGVRYRLPVRFWLRPSIQVAHTWAHVSPSIYNYTFIDTLPGLPPKQTYAITVSQSTSGYAVRGLWRLGFALEHEANEWALRFGALRQEAFREHFYDAWLLQAGLWYKW